MTTMTIAGVVLCGGESRRMGRDKASLPFGGETLLQRVVRQVAAIVNPVIVVAAPGQSLPPLKCDVVRDSVAGRGPWQGISAGLHALRGRADAAFVVSCDSPFLAPGWIQRLAEVLGDQTCAIPLVDGHRQPMAALYRLEAVDAIDRLLADEAGKPLRLFDVVSTRFVTDAELREVDPRLVTLRNVNMPEEYEQALHDAECSDTLHTIS